MRRVLFLAFVLTLLCAGRADAAGLTVTTSDDAVRDVEMSISVSGTATGSPDLYVFISPEDVSCAATAADAAGVDRSHGAVLFFDGEFQRKYTYTPSVAGTYTVCAYVSKPATSTPDAVARVTFAVREQRWTLELAPTMVDDGLVAIVTVSGTGDVPRSLYVHASQGAACGATASADAGDDLTYGGILELASRFADSLSFFTFEGGTWLVCAYLAGSPTSAPDAVASIRVDTGRPLEAPAAAPDPDSPEIPTPVPALLGPNDGAAQEGLNPVFRWARWADADESDTLVLKRRDPDGLTSTLLTLDDEDSDTYHDDAGEPADIYGDTADLATFAGDTTTVSVQLKHPLPPATYVWSVEREDVTSESRTFTVLGPHIARLRATVRSTRGRTAKYPGSSTLHVVTSAAAKVRIALHRQGRAHTLSFTADKNGHVDVTVPWSCAHPGGSYRYVVAASDQYGVQKTKSGHFTAVTRARCRALKRHASRAADRRAATEHAAAMARLKKRCAALGGKSVASSSGPEIVCRSPFGGLLNVPQ